MSVRSMVLMWVTVAILALGTLFVGIVAGYRADEASVAAEGEALNVAEWGAALWTLVAATFVAGVIALAVTIKQSTGTDVKQILAAAALIVIGVAGSAVFLPLALLSLAGTVWLVFSLVRIPARGPITA